MKVEIAVLIENTTPVPGLCGEYGLGILVKVDNHGILFDTGLDDGLVKNMKFMRIDPDEIEKIVISHGHFDHTNGLLSVLEYLGPRDIYLHSEAMLPKYIGKGEHKKEIGIPEITTIESRGGRLVTNSEPLELMPGVFLSGSIPRTNDFEDTGGPFFIERKQQEIPDLMEDEQALIIDTDNGLVIISGCAHAGMINTLSYARQLTGKNKIRAWVGGTHLISASQERILKTIEMLRAYDVESIVVAHCTGFKPTAIMVQELGERVIKAETGYKKTF
ncbi:MAG: MBL fold metallo-hydrolase [Chitinophagales bacterium]